MNSLDVKKKQEKDILAGTSMPVGKRGRKSISDNGGRAVVISLYIPAEWKAKLEKEARTHFIASSQLIRQIIGAHFKA